MTPETGPVKIYSERERAFQRIFDVQPADASLDNARPGRLVTGLTNLGVAASATALDTLEGRIVDGLRKQVTARIGGVAIQEPTPHRELSPTQKKWESGFKNAEEWLSDALISDGADTVVRKLTGVPEATYASRLSKVISEWVNLWAILTDKRVSIPFVGGRTLTMAVSNMVSPVNVEGVYRAVREIPLVGDAIKAVYDGVNRVFEKSKVVSYMNTVAAQVGLGYFIQMFGDSAADRARNSAQAQPAATV